MIVLAGRPRRNPETARENGRKSHPRLPDEVIKWRDKRECIKSSGGDGLGKYCSSLFGRIWGWMEPGGAALN